MWFRLRSYLARACRRQHVWRRLSSSECIEYYFALGKTNYDWTFAPLSGKGQKSSATTRSQQGKQCWRPQSNQNYYNSWMNLQSSKWPWRDTIKQSALCLWLNGAQIVNCMQIVCDNTVIYCHTVNGWKSQICCHLNTLTTYIQSLARTSKPQILTELLQVCDLTVKWQALCKLAHITRIQPDYNQLSWVKSIANRCITDRLTDCNVLANLPAFTV